MVPLAEHGWLWALPIVALALFLVHAMVEFTLALMLPARRRRRNPASAEEIRGAILGLAAEHQHVRIVERSPGWADIEWDALGSLGVERPDRFRLTTRYRCRFLIDDERREVRLWESIRTSGFYYGIEGWRFRARFDVAVYWGIVGGPWVGHAVEIVPSFPPRIGEVHAFQLDIDALEQEIGRVVRRGGWTLRPVVWPFQVHPRLSRLAPGPLRRAPLRRVWGALYPLSYLLVFLAILAFAGKPDTEGWIAIVANVVSWWGAWGLIAWLLVKKPGMSRR